MIEVVIDFNEISFDSDLLKKYKNKKYDHIPKTIKSALIIYLCKKLNIPGVFGWDAFSDNFAELFFKLPPEDYKYRKNDEWCWKNNKEYEGYVKYYNSIGLKNEQGKRDDMKLIFVNFYPFFEKYRSISNDLFEIVLDYINVSSIEEDKCLKLHWHRMVLEIRS